MVLFRFAFGNALTVQRSRLVREVQNAIPPIIQVRGGLQEHKARRSSSSTDAGTGDSKTKGPILHSSPQNPPLSLSFSNSTTTTPHFQLGTLQLSSPIILSPLERISDVGFRRLCHQNGAALTWTEMIYASDLLRPDEQGESRRSAEGRLDTYDPETPTGVQLLLDRVAAKDQYGVDLLWRVLELWHERTRDNDNDDNDDQYRHWNNVCALDLNFGCPSPSISRRGAGPAQLRRRSKMRDLFQVLAEFPASLPQLGAVGAKIRLGNTAREQHYQVYLPVAEAAAECGLDYLTVHARHGDQRSRDPPCWSAIGEIKECVAGSSLKVIGNGDVRTRQDVDRIMSETGCDGVMIGRAAMRNPWCFQSLTTATGGTGNAMEDATIAHGTEWPTPAGVERAFLENEAWSAHRPAAARYQRFRHENFERLRRQAQYAHHPVDDDDNESHCPPPPADWYVEWSQASARRRQLIQLDDDEVSAKAAANTSTNTNSNETTATTTPTMSLSLQHGRSHRTINQREWKRLKQRQKKAAVAAAAGTT